MDELLKKIFESDVLTEESKTELKEAFDAAVSQAMTEARTKAEQDVRAELTEQFVADKEALIEALDTKAEEVMSKELEELKEDIQRYRDLEVEYAQKLVEARSELANVVKNDFAELVEGLDAFLNESMEAEFTELKEELVEARKREFGKKIFEGYVNEYKKYFNDEDETLAALDESKASLEATTAALTEAQKELKQIKRSQEMARVLEPLNGRPREVMEAILKGFATEKLAEQYEAYIGRVLHENANGVEENKSEKESVNPPVLAEGDTSTKETETPTVKTVTGDNEALKESNAALESKLSPESKAKLQRLAGL